MLNNQKDDETQQSQTGGQEPKDTKETIEFTGKEHHPSGKEPFDMSRVKIKYKDKNKIIINKKHTIEIVKNNITLERVDAIVNAANVNLAHGAGVAGALSRKGGPSIQKESEDYIKKNGPLKTGGVAVTGAGILKCKHLIHGVGPICARYPKAKSQKLLKTCVRNVLYRAHKLGDVKSMSMPAISSGVYGCPKDVCAEILITTCVEWLAKNSKDCNIETVRLCDFDVPTLEAF